ncbi:SDR family oxidoreductase [Sciscionella marina]|uniref:SDR family oxidoreductase n=1 Tax=Sciscionella marina TaxID=508770 RepID=UPI00037E1755|nr:SDR family oxidoreductase [Sciscionella marina]
MRVFVTGATGFVGSAAVRELLDAGHQVLGLARSDASAAALTAVGAEVQRGSLQDLDSLRAGAAAADGVIHCAFKHDDFDDFASAAELDRQAIAVLGETLAGTGRPFVAASGLAGLAPGRLATEEDVVGPDSPRHSETVLSFAERGVRASVVRLPPSVHGEGDKGFVPALIGAARKRGAVVYPEQGTNRWCSVHRLDAARLFRLAVESAPAGSRLHAIGDEGVPVREIAEVIGRHLELPVNSVSPQEAIEAIGFVGAIFTLDAPASAARTGKLLDWHPEQVGLIADLEAGHYFG